MSLLAKFLVRSRFAFWVGRIHRPLLRALAAYRTRYPAEAACVDRFIHFVSTHPECFERSLTVGHVTGSAWLVNRAGTHVLLTHHRKLHQWLQLGGHADGNPDVLEVALQEAAEESGIAAIHPVFRDIFDLDIHPIPAHGRTPAHEHYDVRFALRVIGSEQYTVSAESHDLSWVPLEHLAQKTQEPGMFRMQRKWRQWLKRNG